MRHNWTWPLLLLSLSMGACIEGKQRPGDGFLGPFFDGGVNGQVPGVWITFKAGTFWMGSPKSEDCREEAGYKETRHQVTLKYDFEISAKETTQLEYQNMRGHNPSKAKTSGAHRPVEMVNWHDAVAYCNVLSSIKGLVPCYNCTGGKYPNLSCVTAPAFENATQKIYRCPGYRLPTEAEWEYAYRAGTTSAFYSGPITKCNYDDNANKIGWYSGNIGTSHMPRAAGLKAGNSKGLYDMAGNVGEWTQDTYANDLGDKPVTNPVTTPTSPNTAPDKRMLRGGGWLSYAKGLRASHRNRFSDWDRNYDIGFRCVRTLNP